MTADDGRPARPLLEVADIDVVLGRGWRANHVLSGVNLKVWPGRDHRPGRRDRLRQDHPGQDRRRPGPAARRPGRCSTARRSPALRGAARRRERRTGHIQLVFQDPLRSLDPDLTVGDIVGEGLKIRGGLSAAEITARVEDALAKVGLERGAAAPAARADLRRPAAAGLDRPGPGGRPEAAAVRRAGQRARRQQQELHPAAARRAARQPRPADRDHLARPVLAGRHRRPGGRALPGPDRRGRPGGPGVHPAAPPVHRAADGLGARASSTTGSSRSTSSAGPPPTRSRRRTPARASSPRAARSPSPPARSSRRLSR